jgi:dihydrofolate reductase
LDSAVRDRSSRDASFLEQGLIDELHIILTPILLGAGKTVFDGITRRYPLRHLSTKEFKSGSVVLIYEPRER